MALLVAGCGGSDHSETTEETTASTGTSTTVETGALDRLPEVPAATGSSARPVTGGTGGDAFIREVFDDAQGLWREDFAEGGEPYAQARLTIFSGDVRSACGNRSASGGPFYCPLDHGVYMSRGFFEALSRRAGVRLGNFAQAYVVAHELGHHVQTLLGITARLHATDRRDPAGENGRSVRFELQADCLSGVWMHSQYERGDLTQDDLDDALRAAAVAGNDFQQLNAGGTIRPEQWSHGSSAQRRHWVTVGFEDGRPGDCDTFSGSISP